MTAEPGRVGGSLSTVITQRSKDTLRDRVHRVRLAAGWAVQAAVAAGLAWFVAHHVLGHTLPFFAPVAAMVVLAVSIGQRLRRAFEIVVGNAVGILLGEALIVTIGSGWWQISLVVWLAILLAVFVGGSGPLVTQAATSATLVATLTPFQSDYFFSRFVDAVVGGTVGVAVMALLLPLNPLTVVKRAAGPVLEALAKGLKETAEALERRDSALATEALEGLRGAETKLRAFNDSLNAGREISMVAPLRWGKRGALAQYLESYNHVARALRNTRVLVRRGLSMVSDDEHTPPSLIVAVGALAESVTHLKRELAEGTEPVRAREAALEAVRACAEAYHKGLGFSGSVVAAQIRSTASDLISATGLTPEEAHRAVRSVRLPGRE
ncbi:hypothetical protein Rhe02_83310 [Rhizocola hellebori]|uniref:Integral membrane bound transporter domain-containing protein n=1 Tax=Rhizocola hellebori TaxID=1392758 RepID=A0A8J3QIB7_9ACTN|nr:FUSC family protein [Rhizocola hellebori]GIH10264.1 hypothetical protein Rhe02_83310 [Rhizocola hellebori]